MNPLLEIAELAVAFRQGGTLTRVIDRLDLSIWAGETLALVGESGSGKSVTALSVMRLLPVQGQILGGSIRYQGEELLDLPERAMERFRGREMAMIFQDPMTALNPVMTIGEQLLESFSPEGSAQDARGAALALLAQVELPSPEKIFKAYPLALSGGMRQRVLIAMALAQNPALLIADEPTTALDVIHQGQILHLLKRLCRSRGLALWLITHDLGVVHDLADRIVVLKKGRVLEASGREFFEAPKTAYGRALIDAMPKISEGLGLRRSIPGTSDAPPLLEVADLRVVYEARRFLPWGKRDQRAAVDQLALTLGRGETLAVVGRSGCGKTTLARALLGLLPVERGWVRFQGEALPFSQRVLTRDRRIQAVFQDPFASMNPRLSVAEILLEGLQAARDRRSSSECRARILEVLGAMGLDASVLGAYPHEFSGGQRQRLCLARALVLRPEVLVLDEPTSALDVTIQAKVLELLESLKTRFQLSYLLITHDLGVVSRLADRVLVMDEGRAVETGPVARVLTRPRSAAAQALMAALPAIRR